MTEHKQMEGSSSFSCLHQSLANYSSLLSMLASLGINLSSCSLLSVSPNPNTDETRVLPCTLTLTSPQTHSSGQIRDRGRNLGVEGIEALLRTKDTINATISETETSQINQQISTCEINLPEQNPDFKSPMKVLIGNSCLVCGVRGAGHGGLAPCYSL